MKHGTAKLALVLGTALCSTTTAWAQDSGSNSSSDASASADTDIIVTARRTDERLQDVPISITVYNQQQLSQRNVVSGNDIATYTPSLSANSRFGPETASFAIRGFTQENFTSPSVGTYFADVIGPRANGGTNGGNGAGVGQYFDLQNVQVLKGPQGTLFGRNTTGGAILIVPQRPKDDFGGFLEVSGGNYGMYKVTAVLNVPLSDTFKVRLGGERMKRDGYIHNRSGVGPDRYGDVDYWAARLSVLAELTPNLENLTIARYSTSSTNGTFPRLVGANAPGCRDGVDPTMYPLPGSQYITLPGATPATTASFLAPLACSGTLARAKALHYGFWDVESGNPDPFLKIRQWGIINTTTWNASDTLTIKNIASYQQFAQSQSLYIGSDNFNIPDTNPNPAFRGLPFTWVGLYPDMNYHNVEQQTITEELQFQGRSSDGSFNYVVGGYYEHASPLSPWQGSYSPITYVTTLTSAQDPRIPAGVGIPVMATVSCPNVGALNCQPVDSLGTGAFPGLIQNSLTRYTYDNIGFFAQGTYNLTDQLALTAGVRYTIDKTKATGGTQQFFFYAPGMYTAICPGTGAIAAGQESCAVSSHQTSKKPTWLINLDYKPTPDMLFYAKYARGYRQGNINASNTIPQGWGPEKVDSFEVGSKFTLRGPLHGYFNLAAFYNNFTNQQLAASLIPDGSNPGASPAQAIVNAGKSRIYGVEIDSALHYSVFGMQIGYTYLNTKLQSIIPVNFPGYLPAVPNVDVGGPLPLSPKHKLTLTPSLTFPVGANSDVVLSATYVHTGSQKTSADAVTPFGTVPAFDLLNLNLNWSKVGGSPIDLSAFVTNVTNKKYYTFMGGGWQSTGVEYGNIGMPRMWGVRLRYAFGSE